MMDVFDRIFQVLREPGGVIADIVMSSMVYGEYPWYS